MSRIITTLFAGALLCGLTTTAKAQIKCGRFGDEPCKRKQT